MLMTSHIATATSSGRLKTLQNWLFEDVCGEICCSHFKLYTHVNCVYVWSFRSKTSSGSRDAALKVRSKFLKWTRQLKLAATSCSLRWDLIWVHQLKPLYTFGTEKKNHRFTNNFQGLQKVIVKDFSWNIIPWNASLFEKTLKQLSILSVMNYGFIYTCHDTAKRVETRVGFPRYFLPTPMTDWA